MKTQDFILPSVLENNRKIILKGKWMILNFVESEN
jgi:hypothetical protein